SFGDHVMKAKGKVEHGSAKLDVETAGETFPLSFPIGQDMLVQGGFGATTLNMPSLEIGDKVMIDAFDPTTMTKGVALVECVGTENLMFDGQEIPTKILTTELGGVTTKTWVGLDEQIMRVETPVGLILRRVTQSEALRQFGDLRNTELIQTVAVRPAGKKPFRGAKYLRARIGGMAQGVSIPESEFQRRMA